MIRKHSEGLRTRYPPTNAAAVASTDHSRKRMLQWLKDDFNIRIESIESCGNGAMYLQIFDKMFPGVVNMRKVRWDASGQYDITNNYKLLQSVFMHCGIEKTINIQSLMKLKFQDNWEFLQWVHCYYQRRMSEIGARPDYDPVARRELSEYNRPPWTHSMSGTDRYPVPPRGRSRAPTVTGRFISKTGGLPPTVSASTSASSSTDLLQATTAEYDGKIRDLNKRIGCLEAELEDVKLRAAFFENKADVIDQYLKKSNTADVDRATIETILLSDTLIDPQFEEEDD